MAGKQSQAKPNENAGNPSREELVCSNVKLSEARVDFTPICGRSRKSQLLFLLVLLIAIARTPALWNAVTGPDPATSWRSDCDRTLIYKGLTEAPRFRNTFRWWTGKWVGQVPFWRPLTSLGFWLEWKAFGWESQSAWQLVHGFSHLGVVILLFFLVRQLTGSPAVGALTVVLFLGPPPKLSTDGVNLWVTSGLVATGLWKDSPDIWMTASLIAATICAWNPNGAKGYNLWIAVILALAACCFKETGFVGALIVLAVAIYRSRTLTKRFAQELGGKPRDTVPSCLAPSVAFGLLFVLMAAVKWHATGAGYIMGSNVHTTTRAFCLLAPKPILGLASPYGAGVWLGLAMALVPLWPKTRVAALLACGGASMAFIWETVHMSLYRVGIPEAAAMAGSNLMDKPVLLMALGSCIWFYGAIGGWSRLMICLALSSACLLAPAAVAPQVGAHAHYAGNAAGCAAIAVAWTNVWAKRFPPKPPPAVL